MKKPWSASPETLARYEASIPSDACALCLAPMDNDLRKKWKADIDHEGNQSAEHYICHRHFAQG